MIERFSQIQQKCFEGLHICTTFLFVKSLPIGLSHPLEFICIYSIHVQSAAKVTWPWEMKHLKMYFLFEDVDTLLSCYIEKCTIQKID